MCGIVEEPKIDKPPPAKKFRISKGKKTAADAVAAGAVTGLSDKDTKLIAAEKAAEKAAALVKEAEKAAEEAKAAALEANAPTPSPSRASARKGGKK